MAAKKARSLKAVVLELKELYFRNDSEIGGRGLYHKVLPNVCHLGGHIDKDTTLLVKIGELIEEIEEIACAKPAKKSKQVKKSK